MSDTVGRQLSNLAKLKDDFAALSVDERVFAGVDLTVEQQTHERGKPKKYLELTMELFRAIGGETIVEVGCMRRALTHPIDELHPECCNDGHSTYVWAASGATVRSVDINRRAVNTARRSCAEFKNCKVVVGDGIRFLERFKGQIDLLYLDAWDVIPGTDYAENHVLAYLKAKPKLARTNVVSVDDTDIGGGGKGRLLVPVLEADGYGILVRGRQTVGILER